jgi:hypothetical protein
MMDLGCLLELLAFYVHSYLYMFILFLKHTKTIYNLTPNTKIN